jgi:hypothetical protein
LQLKCAARLKGLMLGRDFLCAHKTLAVRIQRQAAEN